MEQSKLRKLAGLLEASKSKNTAADALLLKIAKKHFDVDTLETRNSDSKDFYEVSVWSIKEALEEAYANGYKNGYNSKS